MALAKTSTFLFFLIIGTSGIQARGAPTNGRFGADVYISGCTINLEPNTGLDPTQVGQYVLGPYSDYRNSIVTYNGNDTPLKLVGGVIHYGASSVLINNTIRDGKGGENPSRPSVYQKDNSYPHINVPSEGKAQNNIISPVQVTNSSKVRSGRFGPKVYINGYTINPEPGCQYRLGSYSGNINRKTTDEGSDTPLKSVGGDIQYGSSTVLRNNIIRVGKGGENPSRPQVANSSNVRSISFLMKFNYFLMIWISLSLIINVCF